MDCPTVRSMNVSLLQRQPMFCEECLQAMLPHTIQYILENTQASRLQVLEDIKIKLIGVLSDPICKLFAFRENRLPQSRERPRMYAINDSDCRMKFEPFDLRLISFQQGTISPSS